MSSVLFVMRYPLHKGDNLSLKFEGQMAAARVLGHDVFCIGYDEQGLWLCHGDELTLLLPTHTGRLPGYDKTIFYFHLMAALKEAFLLRPFDMVYLRFARFFPGAPKVIRAIKESGCKLIVEHPTYPFESGKTTSFLRRPVLKLCDHVFQQIEPMIDLYTLIGQPCGDTLHGIPAMNIVNGVDTELLPLHAPRQEADVGILALASMSRWQGYDRLIEAFGQYSGKEAYTVHMVGNDYDGSLTQWRERVAAHHLEEHFIFHGELFGDELNQIVAKCDIGIGGLGLYRKNQLCSMPLKLREYMARGLPFVYAVDDPALSTDMRFCMRVPNDDSIPDAEEILRFAKEMKKDSRAPEEMRVYAREHMSWVSILKTVFEKVGCSGADLSE